MLCAFVRVWAFVCVCLHPCIYCPVESTQHHL